MRLSPYNRLTMITKSRQFVSVRRGYAVIVLIVLVHSANLLSI